MLIMPRITTNDPVNYIDNKIKLARYFVGNGNILGGLNAIGDAHATAAQYNVDDVTYNKVEDADNWITSVCDSLSGETITG